MSVGLPIAYCIKTKFHIFHYLGWSWFTKDAPEPLAFFLQGKRNIYMYFENKVPHRVPDLPFPKISSYFQKRSYPCPLFYSKGPNASVSCSNCVRIFYFPQKRLHKGILSICHTSVKNSKPRKLPRFEINRRAPIFPNIFKHGCGDKVSLPTSSKSYVYHWP